MNKYITITPPSDHYKYEPMTHQLHYCVITGWTVSRIGSECSLAISEAEAQETIASWKLIDEDTRKFEAEWLEEQAELQSRYSTEGREFLHV